MGRWAEWIAFAIAGAALVLIAGSWNQIEVKGEVNISDLLGVLATVVLTVLVAILGQKRFSEDRAEKELLIETVQDAVASTQAVTAEVTAAYKRQQNDNEATTRLLDDLGADLTALVTLLGEAKHAAAFQTAQKLYRTDFKKLRQAVSGGTFPAQPYSAQAYTAAKYQGDALVVALRRLVFVVNRK